MKKKKLETNRNIYITKGDYDKLIGFTGAVNLSSEFEKKSLNMLKNELDRAIIVEPKKTPKDVITMNSKVCFQDLDSGEEVICTLVYPKDANIDQKKISILAPIGTALIGYKEGDIIEWEVPSGLKRIKIKKLIYQPEREGHYYL